MVLNAVRGIVWEFFLICLVDESERKKNESTSEPSKRIVLRLS